LAGERKKNTLRQVMVLESIWKTINSARPFTISALANIFQFMQESTIRYIVDFGWLAKDFPVPTNVPHTDGRDPYWR
jgi:hypothetical protein